jgi:hypothetical protein
MKKKNLILIGIILIFISFFVGKSYQSFQDIQNPKYKKIDSTQIQYILNQKAEAEKIKNEVSTKKIIPKTKPKIIKKKVEPKRTKPTIQKIKSTTSKNILRYKSTFNDYENETDIIETNYEVSYHTFDFDNKTITMKSRLKSGKWKTFTFKWTKITEPYDNGYIEFNIVNDKGIYQIWRSSVNTIGYEFYNKEKLVYNDVIQIK